MPNILAKRLGVPYKSLPNEDEYDYYNAYSVPEGNSHWDSRNPTTGRILKSGEHPTFMDKTVPSEYEAGYKFYTDPLGNLYSFGPDDEIPYLQRPLITERKYTDKPKSLFYMDPEELVLRQAYMESVFNPKAGSNKGAKGMFQVKDGALSDYIKDTNDVGDIYDPIYNKRVRDWLMNRLYNSPTINTNNPSEEVRLAKTLAAYNWGRKNLENYLVSLKNQNKDIYSDNSWMEGIPLETRNYINFILFHKPTESRSDEELENLKHLYNETYSNRGTK